MCKIAYRIIPEFMASLFVTKHRSMLLAQWDEYNKNNNLAAALHLDSMRPSCEWDKLSVYYTFRLSNKYIFGPANDWISSEMNSTSITIK